MMEHDKRDNHNLFDGAIVESPGMFWRDCIFIVNVQDVKLWHDFMQKGPGIRATFEYKEKKSKMRAQISGGSFTVFSCSCVGTSFTTSLSSSATRV